MTGIIGAMQIEVDALRAKVKNAVIRRISGIEFVAGTLFGKDVVIARSGVGKVFAAVCAQTMILEFGVRRIINTGVAGALEDGLSAGDIAVAAAVVQHDMDTTALGDPAGLISGLGIVYIPAAPALSAGILAAAAALGFNCRLGNIASGDVFVAQRELKEKIRNRFSAVACEMEGAAIGQVCHVNGVDFAVIRAISDSADAGAGMSFAEFAGLAASRSSAIIEKLLPELTDKF